jgi:hypothetical protein
MEMRRDTQKSIHGVVDRSAGLLGESNVYSTCTGRLALPVKCILVGLGSICGSVLLGEFAVVFRQQFKGRRPMRIFQWLLGETPANPGHQADG